MNTAYLTGYDCLSSIYNDKAFSTIELNKRLCFCRKKDKALITKIVYGVLDNDILLDYVIGKFCTKVKPAVKLYLKIGTYVLMFLSIPANAVVNDVVEISKNTGKIQLVGFVNATLKAISKAILQNEITYPEDKKEFLSVRYSYPMWAVKKLIKDYGIEEAEKIISYPLSTDSVLRINTDKTDIETFKRLLTEQKITYFETCFEDALTISGNISGIDDSLFTFQSISSMYVCKSLDLKGKCRVLDCCSAPGGKAVYLKQLDKDAEITACDLHEHRVELIKSYAKRLNVELNVYVKDATEYDDAFEKQFDYVLCDVPCSGFGVVNNHPDIKLFRQNEDISSLMQTQRAILSVNKNYAKVGGILLYSTCTVFKNENEEMIKRFLRENDSFALERITALPMENDGTYQFLPHKDDTQGFFVARMIRLK